jgi:putative endonuclease
MWYVYILRCNNDTLYTGVTTDLKRRFREHQAGEGAQYTRAFGAKELVYSEQHETRSAAQKREAEIKGWSREQKLTLIQKGV